MKGINTKGMGGLVFAFFFFVALWAIVGHPITRIDATGTSGKQAASASRSGPLVPSPVLTEEWAFHLSTDYGQGNGGDGVKGLEFFSDSRSPNQFVNSGRTYVGNTASGTIMPTSAVSASPPFTFTGALDDTDAAALPDRFTFTADCPVVLPSIYVDYVDIHGTVTSLDCGLIQSGPCKMQIHLDKVNGLPCP